MLDINKSDFKILSNILNQQLNNDTEVFAFGSRVKNTARKYSDLDLLIKSEQPLNYLVLSDIQEALSESNLSFRVDLVEWQKIDDEFMANIKNQLVKIK